MECPRHGYIKAENCGDPEHLLERHRRRFIDLYPTNKFVLENEGTHNRGQEFFFFPGEKNCLLKGGKISTSRRAKNRHDVVLQYSSLGRNFSTTFTCPGVSTRTRTKIPFGQPLQLLCTFSGQHHNTMTVTQLLFSVNLTGFAMGTAE